MDDDDMSVSEDGGVRLDLDFDGDANSVSNQVVPFEQGLEDTYQVEQIYSPQHEESMYHQDREKLDHQGPSLWRLPITPIPHNFKDFSHVAKVYHKSCQIIQSRWKCSPQDGMPEALQASTPYSLAMLLQLRMLSSYSKRARARTHGTLVQQWKARLSTEGIDPDEVVYRNQCEMVRSETFGGNPNHLKSCEHTIQENRYGLMLEDVAKTFEIVRAIHRENKREANLVKRAAKEARGIAPKRAKKAKRNASRTYPPVEDTTTQSMPKLDNTHLARLVEKVGGLSLRNASSGDELVGIEYNTDLSAALPSIHPMGASHESSGAKLTGSEKDTMQQISLQLGAIQLHHKKVSKQTLRRTLERTTTKHSGNGSGSSSLPSERSDFGVLP